MESSISIPLHFSLEFLGVAAFGGLFAWALQSGRRAVATGLGVLLGAETLHAGQFVTAAGPARVLGWITVGAAVATAVCGATVADRALWFAGWILVAASSTGLAAMDPHAGEAVLTSGELALHGLGAAGAILLGIWAWRRALTSVRLRVVGAFALVLLVVVLVAAGSVVRVVASNLENEELRRLGVQVQAEQVEFANSLNDIARRSGILSAGVTGVITRGGSVSQAAADTRKVFTDVAFIAVFSPQGQVMGQDGLGPSDAALLPASEPVAAALRGQAAQALLPADAALLAVAAAPVYRANVPQSPESVLGAVVLGLRYGKPQVDQIARDTGLATALVLPDGRALVASDEVLARERLPLGLTSLETGDRRFLVAAAPLVEPGGKRPAWILVATSDTAMARTAVGVSKALFGAVLAATLIAILIALWFGSRLARPILKLATTARRVEEGDLEATTDVRSKDELGTLASAFDEMTTSLRDTIATEQGTRRRLETIVSGMGDGLVAMDADFNVTSFNPAAEAITGVKAQNAIGRKCHDVYGKATAGPDGRPICDYICPIRHGGGRDGGVVIHARDGQSRSLAVTCSTLRDEEGNVIGGVDLISDVTPEMQAEQMKSNFLSNISHELRTPLTPIKGFADVMRRKEVPRDKQVEYLGEIVASTDRLERIVAILVDVAAMEAGRLRVNPAPHDAAGLVRQTVDRWRERGVLHEIVAVAPRDLPQVGADVPLIPRALDELIDNAVKFSPEGGRITVRARRVPRGVEFSVTDRGIGIERPQLETLFEEFVQADPTETRAFGGLGVGLAFVRRVVEAHGSRLDVESKPGKGSTFSFVLRPFRKPAARKPAARKPAARKPAARRKPRAAKRPSRRRA